MSGLCFFNSIYNVAFWAKQTKILPPQRRRNTILLSYLRMPSFETIWR